MVSSHNFDDTSNWPQSIERAKHKNEAKVDAFNALLEGTSGAHQWSEVNHSRPTFCNYCREKLSGVPWHGYTCDVCKIKAHRKCMENITDSCKWSVESMIPRNLRFINPDNSILPHQWVEGNLRMPVKCVVCEKPCGSVRRLQDWRCLWCSLCVHSSCLSQIGRGCTLGPTSLSVIPPLAVKEVDEDGKLVLREDAYGGACGGGSPLIALINGKSGDNQGQRIIKKFRRLLNPCQVFDIITTGPEFALNFFSRLESFRVLVCGGDGSVGWVLSTLDRLNLHSKCQLSILPLGTGNDLARVLGWGHAFYDDKQLPEMVRTLERAHCKMLDRWSVMSVEGAVNLYEDAIMERVSAVLTSENPKEIFESVKALCTKLKELTRDNVEWDLNNEDNQCFYAICQKYCNILLEKFDRFIQLYSEGETGEDSKILSRSSSVKKALKNLVTMAQQEIDKMSPKMDGIGVVKKRPIKNEAKLSIPTIEFNNYGDGSKTKHEQHDKTNAKSNESIKPSSSFNSSDFKKNLDSSEPDTRVDEPKLALMKNSQSDSSIYEKSLGSSKNESKTDDMRKNVLTLKSIISNVLLLSSRMFYERPQIGLSSKQYQEKCVMNNYFGIGLDAKIAWEFHNKREESEKARSRSKLFLWYGMLGGKELMHRTYRNLEQRIRLECDGVRIELPSLQGIVILNIPSYSGGANFWGRYKDETFSVQSFDDRLLEVVALFGVIHVATSRVPNAVRLQNHRIAQCRHVRIIILGNDPIPVQVDGEPWLQPPGIMQIVHKNRAHMLARNPVFDATLKKWEEQKERSVGGVGPSTPVSLSSGGGGENVVFAQRAAEFVRLAESEIAQLRVSSAFLEALEEASMLAKDGTTEKDEDEREEVLAAVERVVELLEDHFGWPEWSKSTSGPMLAPAPCFNFEINEPVNWRYVLNRIRQDMEREDLALREIRHQELMGKRSKRSRVTEWFSKKLGSSSSKLLHCQVNAWSTDDVCLWLSKIGLSEYSEQFKLNDVQGSELVHLERSDIQELGVKKIGHIKRLQSAIEELRLREKEKKRTRNHAKGESTSRRKQKSVSVERCTTWAEIPAERDKISVNDEKPTVISM